jgi:hypothetical protein
MYFGHFFQTCVLDQLKCDRLAVVKIKGKTGCNSAIYVIISWFVDGHVQNCPPLGVRTEEISSCKVKGQQGILIGTRMQKGPLTENNFLPHTTHAAQWRHRFRFIPTATRRKDIFGSRDLVDVSQNQSIRG